MPEITNEINVAIVGGAGFMGRAHSSALALADLSGLGVRVNRRVLVEPNAEVGRAAAQDLHWRERKPTGGSLSNATTYLSPIS